MADFDSAAFDPFDPDSGESDTGVPAAPHGQNKTPSPAPLRQNTGSPSPAFKSNNPFYNPFLRSASPHTPESSRLASSSFLALNSPELFGLQTPPLERQKSLGDYFSIDEVPRTTYSDKELANIARLLEATGRESWSKVPRIYTVLRIIGQITVIDSFLDQGLNDMWFPFNITQLPLTMSTFHRGKFMDVQNMVFTKALELENADVKKHTHFKKGEDLPLTIGDELGHGGFGYVHKAHSPLTGRTYALKRFRRVKRNRREVESFMTELQVLQKINHHHCVELVASYTDSRHFGLLISPVADCNLATFYGIVTTSEESQKILRRFFGCLAHALQYLHHNKIRHRDIKPENVLVMGEEVYLADFGISLDWENLTRSTTTQDSAKSWIYCAPEIASYQKRNSSSDIWSLGCVFLEMFTALKGLTNHDLRAVLTAHSGQPRFYENLDPAMQFAEKLSERGLETDKEIIKWIREMMVIAPAHRITAQSLCVTIVKFGFKTKNKEEADMFCGDCCTHDHELELSSGTVSDDEVWEGDFGALSATPATTSATDQSRRVDESTPAQEVQLQQVPSESALAEALQRSKLSDTPKKGPANDDEQDEETVREFKKRPTAERIRSDEIRSTIYEGDRKPKLRKRTATNQSSDSMDSLLRRPTAINQSSGSLNAVPSEASGKAIAIKESKEGTPPAAESHKTKADLKSSRNVEMRQQLIREVTDKNMIWPYVDLKNRLPALTGTSWELPSKFLESVRSDTVFMDHLRVMNPTLLEQFKSATQDDLFQMIHLLLRNGLNINDRKYRLVDKGNKNNKKHYMPLMLTIRPPWMATPALHDIAKLLIGFKADITYESDDEVNAFAVAVFHGNSQILQILLQHAPTEFYRQDVDRKPPIFTAASRGHHKCVDVLIKHGFNLQRSNSNGLTALNAAAGAGHLEVVKTLIKHGMDADDGKSFFTGGWRPIHSAAGDGHLEVVRYLLSKGADPTRRAPGGYITMDKPTPLGLAKQSGNQELVKLIEDAIVEWKIKKRKQ